MVDAFGAVLTQANPETFVEIPIRPASLKTGMRVSRDLMHSEGYLLLARDHIISASDINQLMSLEAADMHPLILYVVK